MTTRRPTRPRCVTGAACALIAGRVPRSEIPENRKLFRSRYVDVDGKIPATYVRCSGCGESCHGCFDIFCRRCGCKLPPPNDRHRSISELNKTQYRVFIESIQPPGGPIMDAYLKTKAALDWTPVPCAMSIEAVPSEPRPGVLPDRVKFLLRLP